MDKKTSGFSIELDETHLKQIEDVSNSNIEVVVRLEDGFPLRIVVGTPKNLQYLMEKSNMNFYPPGRPWIIVQKLTKEIIYEAIKDYLDYTPEGYRLKLYHFALDIDIAVFNQLQAKQIEEAAKSELVCDLYALNKKINKLDNLDKSKKSDLVTSFEKLYKILNEDSLDTLISYVRNLNKE